MSLEQNLLMFCLTRLDEFKIRQDIFQHTPSHIPTTNFFTSADLFITNYSAYKIRN